MVRKRVSACISVLAVKRKTNIWTLSKRDRRSRKRFYPLRTTLRNAKLDVACVYSVRTLFARNAFKQSSSLRFSFFISVRVCGAPSAVPRRTRTRLLSAQRGHTHTHTQQTSRWTSWRCRLVVGNRNDVPQRIDEIPATIGPIRFPADPTRCSAIGFRDVSS